ncbi:MAG: hypothetical protein QMD11_11535, partial [Smithella sp.]|nr:hypothetical protein [Smithella sp.]
MANLKKSFLKTMVIGLFLLNASFFAVYYLKYGTLAIAHVHQELLLLFYGSWLLISLLTKKFNPESYTGYWKSFFVIARSNLFLLFFVSFWVVILSITQYSRIHIFGTICLLFCAELVIFSVYHLLFRKQTMPAAKVVRQRRTRSYSLLISDYVLLTLAFFLIHYFKR